MGHRASGGLSSQAGKMDGTLDDFLSQCVFRDTHRTTICAKEEEQRRFDIYMKQYDNLAEHRAGGHRRTA